MKQLNFFTLLLCAYALIFLISCGESEKPTLKLEKGSRIVLIGNNLGSRMMEYGHFETELHMRYPDSSLFIRNMCDPGNTAGFRPHSSRNEPWAFPGAEEFQTELANPTGSEGSFPTEDEWLTNLQADIVIGFFGFSESFDGDDGLDLFEAELQAFVKHVQTQNYNGKEPPQLALISPVAFEDLSSQFNLPEGDRQNNNISNYSIAMKSVSRWNDVFFVNAFVPTFKRYVKDDQMTIDGSQLNEKGYRELATFLADELFGVKAPSESLDREAVREAVNDKNWYWKNDFKIPNGVHVHGRRFDPFGPDNYPHELKKTREMTAIRDTAIWSLLEGITYDVGSADQNTYQLPEVKTNYSIGDYGRGGRYLYGKDALKKIYTAPGYKIDLFASEQEFPDLANPVQISFDNKGRLWVATMPSYPHYRIGDPKPNDKLIILEDTDGDGKADSQKTFVDGLHLPVGFEIAHDGVYISQGGSLKFYMDTDGDDKADSVETLLSGFDDHDTHHAISAFTADPSGALYMAEGVFLHSNVETSYGPVRASNGGFYRFDPNRKRLERTAQIAIPNPWGIAFDDWGQHFYLETSGPDMRWMMPSTLRPVYGKVAPKSPTLIEEDHLVRPTSGLEFVASRHFPDEVQGDILLGNTIGYLGVKQHSLTDDSSGYKSKFRQDLVWSDDPNFRPVDLEFAPDGSLYLADWHNVLIGHMQHNARDPMRDHVHGRIYRVTYPSRPLVQPANVADATIDELLYNLTLPEARTRYRTRRELRGRNLNEIYEYLDFFLASLDPADPMFEHHLLEVLWVTWGKDRIDPMLLREMLKAQDYRVRAAAVRALGYVGHQIPEQPYFMITAAGDENKRVRLEAIVAASWFDQETGLSILGEAGKYPLDDWMIDSYLAVQASLTGEVIEDSIEVENPEHLSGEVLASFERGKAIYARDGHCGTCHQPNGKGLRASGFPPLIDTKWVLGDEERLIKLTLKGLFGPIQVRESRYKGFVPMTPFGGLLDDEEIADVLTYVRNAFGNQADPISAEKVAEVRAATVDQTEYYAPDDLLAAHPDPEDK